MIASTSAQKPNVKKTKTAHPWQMDKQLVTTAAVLQKKHVLLTKIAFLSKNVKKDFVEKTVPTCVYNWKAEIDASQDAIRSE